MRLLYVLAAFLAISQSCGNEEDDCHKTITFLNQTETSLYVTVGDPYRSSSFRTLLTPDDRDWGKGFNAIGDSEVESRFSNMFQKIMGNPTSLLEFSEVFRRLSNDCVYGNFG
jgi:hypothetical protein